MNCIGGCFFPASFPLSTGYMFKNLLLPPWFSIVFNLRVSALAGNAQTRLNIFEMVDLLTQKSYVAARLTDTVNTEVSFNGTRLSSNGVNLYDNYTVQATSLRFHVYPTKLRTKSNAYIPVVLPQYNIVNTYTTNRVFSLYFSSPTELGADGVVSQVQFITDTPNPTTMPTMEPSFGKFLFIWVANTLLQQFEVSSSAFSLSSLFY